MIKDFLVKHNIIKGKFSSQAFVYVDKNGNVTREMTDRVKWLSPITVTCFYKESDRRLFEEYGEKYPKYKGYFNLF